MQNFPKNERLCGKKNIDNLFYRGSSISNTQIKIIWDEQYSDITLKTLIVVPKKNIKKAVDRNMLKRRIREVFRVFNSSLKEEIKKKNKKLVIAIIYRSNEILSHKMIKQKISLILIRLIKTI